jgi:glycosyltransferase involved in cell wall biosynthesis
MAIEFSVVIPCYTEGPLLLEAVESVLQQSYPPLEVIIVNDASPNQATRQVCQQVEQNEQVSVIWKQHNEGPAAAINQGFSKARGNVFLNLDADDLLPPDTLRQAALALTENPQIDWVYGNYLRQETANHAGQVIDPRPIDLSIMLSSKRFFPSSRWTLRATNPMRRRVWETLGGHDSQLGAKDIHDLEFVIRLLNSHFVGQYIPHTMYVWRKYLGHNTRLVSPLSWYKIAQKHQDVYAKHGLRYRALELLLWGSKWLGKTEDIRYYRQELIGCIQQGQFKLPTLMALMLPTPLFRPIARLAGSLR